MALRLLALLACTLVVFVRASEWNYDEESAHGPSHWYVDNPYCGGISQSPVDLVDADYDATLDTLSLSGYDTNGTGSYILKNNGHSVVVSLPDSGMTLSGGIMMDTFTLAQFHFHWGSDSSKGSEHTIKSKQYAAEMHLVHYNSDKYTSVAEAMDQSDGLAVLGVMIKEGDENPAYDKIIEKLEKVPLPESSEVTLDKFPLINLLPQLISPIKFLTYKGSLTTPPCYESVTWNVLDKHVTLSAAQLEAFRALLVHEDEHLVDNFRPLQPINGRPITASWQQPA